MIKTVLKVGNIYKLINISLIYVNIKIHEINKIKNIKQI